ncbi:MAG: FAD-dependent oxidoreductase [Pseudomonadota bacterium]
MNAAAVECDLCVVGAGIAGLNVAHAATNYDHAKSVVIVDRIANPGGMWNNIYDFVRLHQPHPLFTAGDVPWNLNQPPAYLASKKEVVAHTQHCLNAIRKRAAVHEYFEHDFQSLEEQTVDGQEVVDVALQSLNGGASVSIRARQVIKAFGYDIKPLPALNVSSTRIISVSPHDTALFDSQHANSPVYIVGGGKTAMDTACTLLKQFPGRPVTLIIGHGTMFINRDRVFPRGLSRWFGGSTLAESFMDVTMRYNGDNEDEMLKYFNRQYGLSLGDAPQNFFFGALSEQEFALVKGGARQVVVDYFKDVVDSGERTEIHFNNLPPQPIEPGAMIVNCSGYTMREVHPYEPYVSPSGKVIAVQNTSSIHFLTTFAGYYFGHLWGLGNIREVPLYAMNLEELAQRHRKVFGFAAMSHMMYNTLVVLGSVPIDVMANCGLDFERWYPLPRRLWVFSQLKRRREELLSHLRVTLDRVCNKYGIEGGVMVDNSVV